MAKQKFFNNPKANIPKVLKNRRDADSLINSTYKAFMLLGIMALRDEFGFGTERLQRWRQKMSDVLDSYNKGYIGLYDLDTAIYEETGIKIL